MCIKEHKQARDSEVRKEKPNLPDVQSDGLVPLVLWAPSVLDWRLQVFLQITPFSMLKQGQDDLCAVTHSQPELGVAVVAAAVPTAPRGEPLRPSANQLVSVSE